MPEKVIVKVDGLVKGPAGILRVVVDGRGVRLPSELVYEQDQERLEVVIPRWLAEEQDIEHRVSGAAP